MKPLNFAALLVGMLAAMAAAAVLGWHLGIWLGSL